MDQTKLLEKVAIITGSSSGIGAAIAIEMSRLGARVTIHGRNTSKLTEVATQCEEASPGKKKVCIVIGDLVYEDVRKKLIAKTVECFGKLDILVNNAGSVKFATVEDVSLEALDFMLDIHTRVPYHLTKLATPELIKNKGSVVNISSIASERPNIAKLRVEYGMAKAALDQCTLSMAKILGEKGVRVNSINPGGVVTALFSNYGLSEEQIKQQTKIYSQMHALNRFAKPEEIAKVAAFLVSEDAAFITGLIMPVDGGFSTMPTGPRFTKF